ncbi:hypothetical protein ACWC09_30230 [Streptomyces sp. NPDC001617]
MLTSRAHQRTRQHLADVPFDGPVVGRLKERSAWAEVLGSRRSFIEHADQVLPRARLAARLKDAILNAVSGEVRAIGQVAGQFDVSWPSWPGPGTSMSTSSAESVGSRTTAVRDGGSSRGRPPSSPWPQMRSSTSSTDATQRPSQLGRPSKETGRATVGAAHDLRE